jgi:outer membrane biosynthesis protein TonB
MTFKNITTNSILNAAGRLVDPGKTILMEVEYYEKHKSFVDKYVKEGKAEIGGLDEYEEFLKNKDNPKEEEKKEKVDLIAEVQAEEAKKEEKPEVKKEEPKEEEPKEEEPQEEEKPKKTRRRKSKES